jgi:hypothetical protein
MRWGGEGKVRVGAGKDEGKESPAHHQKNNSVNYPLRCAQTQSKTYRGIFCVGRCASTTTVHAFGNVMDFLTVLVAHNRSSSRTRVGTQHDTILRPHTDSNKYNLASRSDLAGGHKDTGSGSNAPRCAKHTHTNTNTQLAHTAHHQNRDMFHNTRYLEDHAHNGGTGFHESWHLEALLLEHFVSEDKTNKERVHNIPTHKKVKEQSSLRSKQAIEAVQQAEKDHTLTYLLHKSNEKPPSFCPNVLNNASVGSILCVL